MESLIAQFSENKNAAWKLSGGRHFRLHAYALILVSYNHELKVVRNITELLTELVCLKELCKVSREKKWHWTLAQSSVERR